jgi:RND family efflux transporter MFP subunit
MNVIGRIGLTGMTASCAVLLFLSGCGGDSHEQKTQGSRAVVAPRYHCPMHPAVVSGRPGTCPICFMDLEAITESAQTAMKGTVTGRTTVVVPAETRQKMGLTLGKVERKRLVKELRVAARIVPDETRLHRVTTKVEGWVERLDVNVTGQRVRKGDQLLSIYSPQLVSAQEEYLGAAAAAGRLPGEAAKGVVAAARQRLQLWDVTGEQISALEAAGRPERAVTVHAPAGGWVLEKGVLSGQKVTPGDPLFVIADLSEVWVSMEVYEPDLRFVTNGMPARVTLQAMPGRVFQCAVNFVAPTLDPVARTVRVRAALSNPELLLKAEMLGEAVLSADLGEQSAIPESAVLRTGAHTYAFRDAGEGRLEPIEIKIGPRCGSDFVLLEGLFDGETVVTSANFLIDSESSIRAALEALRGTQGTNANATVDGAGDKR